jgi:hypothetical protein
LAARDEERRRLEKLEELERKQREKSSVATINLLANNYPSITDSPTFKRKFEKLEDGGYAHKSNPGAPAFFENNGRIELQSSAPEVIKDLVQVLHERGVPAISIEGGTPEVNDRLWLQANLLGMQVHGYTPENPAIHAELEQLRAQQPKPIFWDKTNLDPDYHAIVDAYNEELKTLASDLRGDPQQYAIEVDALGAEYGQKAKKIAEAKQASQQELVSPDLLQADDVTVAQSEVENLESIKKKMEQTLRDSRARIEVMEDANKLTLCDLVESNARMQMASLASDSSHPHAMEEAAELLSLVNSNLTQIEAGTHAQLQTAQESKVSQSASSSPTNESPTESDIQWMKKFVSEIVLEGDKLTPVLINGMADVDRLKFLREVEAQQKANQMKGKIQVAKWSDSNLKFGERVTEDSTQGITLKQGQNEKRTKIFVVSAADAAGKLGYSPGQANSEINGGAIKKGSEPRTLAKL